MTSPESELPDVHTAINRVMKEVQAIGKTQEYKEQGRTQYRFRGIDDVLDAVGPVFRTHGVYATPVGTNLISAERYETKSGARMQNVIVEMRYEITGPRGDMRPATTMGQASDAGDKAIPKAQSVAYRDMLCELLCIPTGVTDPSSEQHEAAAPGQEATQERPPSPRSAVDDQITEWATTLGWTREQVYDAYAKWFGGQLLNEADVTQRAKFVQELGAHHRTLTSPAAVPAPKTNVPDGAHVAGGPYPPVDIVAVSQDIRRMADSLGLDERGLTARYAEWNGGHDLAKASPQGVQAFQKQLAEHLRSVQEDDQAARVEHDAMTAAQTPATDEPPF